MLDLVVLAIDAAYQDGLVFNLDAGLVQPARLADGNVYGLDTGFYDNKRNRETAKGRPPLPLF